MAKIKTDKIETKLAAFEAKLAALGDFLNAGGLQIVAEPKRWAYPDIYAPDPDPEKNYYAVYGPTPTLDALQSSRFLTKSEVRPRVDSETEGKAYLDNDIALAFLIKHPEIKTHIPSRLFSLSNDPQEPTLACFNTGRPIEGDTHADGTEPDTLSYLLLSASDERRFGAAVGRLTVDGPRKHFTVNHYGRDVGEFMILPIRHSMVESIRRANLGLIELQPDEFDMAQAQGADMAKAMQHIMATLQGDERFLKEPETKNIHPNARVEREPQAEFEPRPLVDFLDELRPHIQGFQRIEQFSGSFDTTMNVTPSAELAALIKKLKDPRQSTQAAELSFTPILENSKAVAYKINQATYDSLSSLIDGTTITENLSQQKFNPHWTQVAEIKYLKPPAEKNGFGKKWRRKRDLPNYDVFQESVHSLHLAWNNDGNSEQHWLVVEADSLERGIKLADSMSVARAGVRKLTAENEKPALIRIPISATMAESLRENDAKRELDESRAKEMPIDSEEAPYDSLEALDAAQRSRASVEVPPPKSKKTQKPTVPPKPATRSEADVLADAEKLIFLPHPALSGETNGERAPHVWTIVYDGKKPAPPADADLSRRLDSGEVFLGIKIPKSATHTFDQELHRIGFKGHKNRRLNFVGSVGTDHIYKLSLARSDALAFEKYLTPESALTNASGAASGFYSQTGLKDALTRHFEITETPEIPVDTYAEAWTQLANLTKDGTLKYVQVRYDEVKIAKALEHLQTKLARAKALAAASAALDQLSDESAENPLAELSPRLAEQAAEIDSMVSSQESYSKKLREKVDAAEKEMSMFRAWVDAQPRQVNGDILVTNLVIPDPSSNIINHVQTLHAKPYKPHGATEKDPDISLFPGPVEVVKGAMADKVVMVGNREEATPRNVLLVPVVPQFFDVLRLYAPENEVAPLVPIDISRELVVPSLRSELYVEPPPKEVVEKDRTHDPVAGPRITLPLRSQFIDCRKILRFATLKEEHANENLASISERWQRKDGTTFVSKEMLGDRIGGQHAVMFRISNAKDWKHADTLLRELSSLDWLANRERYGGLIEAPLPDDLQAAINQRDHAARRIESIEVGDLLFHLQQIATGKSTEFSLPRARNAAKALCEAVEPGEVAATIKDLLRIIDEIDATKLAPAHAELETIFNALREAVEPGEVAVTTKDLLRIIDAIDATKLAPAHEELETIFNALREAVAHDEEAKTINDLLQTNGEIDNTKLTTAHEKLGVIINELRTRRNEAQERAIQLGIHYKIPETDARMAPEIIADEAPLAYLPGHDDGVALSELAELMPKNPGDEETYFVVYLGLDDKREADRNMLEAMKSCRPTPNTFGARSAQALEEKYGRTSNITLDDLFAERGKHYGISAALG